MLPGPVPFHCTAILKYSYFVCAAEDSDSDIPSKKMWFVVYGGQRRYLPVHRREQIESVRRFARFIHFATSLIAFVVPLLLFIDILPLSLIC